MAEAGAAPGRRPNPVLGDEPAVSYLTALRRWPDEVAAITRTALAARMGVQPNVVTNALNHSRGWRATPGRLRRALEIIEKCSGTSEDLDRWTRYHAEVQAYEVRGRRGSLPVPPEPSVSGWSVDARVGGARREPPGAGVPAELVPASMATRLIEPSSALGPVRAPSGLLRAERGVVEFRHRDAVLAELRSWLEGPAAVSVRVLTGPGGQGKTRLAAELVAQRRTAGWVAGPLAPELSADEVAVACQAAIPLLLVVDYAEGRIDDVVQLLAALVPDRLHPARVLLVSRSAGDWLDEAREHEDDAVADLLAGDVEVPLPPILPRPVDRPTEFVRALAAFARELGTTTAGVVVPDNFDDDRYGCALDLHAAALAALLDRDDSAGPLGDPLARVLHHERRFWRRTLPGFDLPDPHAARLGALVATATAFGADDQDRAAAVLGATSTLRGQLQDVLDRYLAWFRDVYPGQTALGALRPDRLGEDHVADVLRTRPDVLTGPMAVADARQRERALTVLGRAVARHADVAIPLARLLATDPGPLLALGARVAAGLADPVRFTAVMGEVAGEIGDVDVLWTLAAGLPETSLFLADYTAVVAEGLRQACEDNGAPLDELAV
ncbi:hypothetical protein LNK82_43715, partial [Saccharothrix sp. NEAU-S10]|nr:hypothetical protein [Saccharothrix luteola]